MDPYKIIDKYVGNNSELRELLTVHSEMVRDKALTVVRKHPELNADAVFVEEAAMLHDIGIFLTDAPSIYCYGREPYLCHGILGARLMTKEGYPRHARVCARHTGAGLTREEIIEQDLPLPHQDFLPETTEEKIICYADKFYSKTRLREEKSIEKILKSLRRFGGGGAERFMQWHALFG